MKELLVRSITGLVYGLLLIGSVIIHPIAFLIVYLAITLLCLNEFIRLNNRDGIWSQKYLTLLLGTSVFVLPFLIYYDQLPQWVLVFLPLLILLLFTSELFRKEEKPFSNLGISFTGIVYIALPMALLNYLVFKAYSASYSHHLLIFLLMVIWLNDSGAYLIGLLIGKHKMFARISPKKTWEGLIGGFITAFLATAIFGNYYTEIPRLDQWIITGSIVVFGTFGDLVESMLKRSIGVKDSGNALPGHGGWLDRLDSILFAAPAVFISVIILNAI